MIKLKTALLVHTLLIALLSHPCIADSTVPVEPLQGMSGLEEAIAIQQETGTPIILFSTWNSCPHSRKIAKWFGSPTVSEALNEYPRVILASKGNDDEETESDVRGFTGGNFYVITDYYFDSGPYPSIWAWQTGSYKIKKDLLQQILNNL